MTAADDLTWPARTRRLQLRPLTASDAPEIWSWYSRPEVTEYTPTRYADLASFAARMEATAPSTLSVLHQERIVAIAKLHVQDGWGQSEVADATRAVEAELGWIVDPGMHGQGIGTETAAALRDLAFDRLGVRRIVAHCFSDNEPSWRIMARIGMSQEALFREESLHRSGRWLDSMTWAMLATGLRPAAALQ